ncbi:hypothetical protein, partial [Escherichia coli]|uniref:hypothetical protein n=1 Tax=Escherichia coli TaxID=562 RepID=UPI001BFC2F00
MLPSETMIWQPEFTDKILSRKPGAVQSLRQYVFFSDDYSQEYAVIPTTVLLCVSCRTKKTMDLAV